MCLDNNAVFVALDMVLWEDMADRFYKFSTVCWVNATVIHISKEGHCQHWAVWSKDGQPGEGKPNRHIYAVILPSSQEFEFLDFSLNSEIDEPLIFVSDKGGGNYFWAGFLQCGLKSTPSHSRQ